MRCDGRVRPVGRHPAGPGTQAGGQQAARTAAGAGAAPPDPAVLAALARQTLGLPSPVIRSSPAQNALQLTNLPTWLWINPAEWAPESKTATVLAPLFTTAVAAFRVAESQALNTSGGT